MIIINIIYDLVIENGLIIDGNNNPSFNSNIGIIDDKIKIITSDKINGKIKIDASNKIVCPGFIDIHSHSDIYYYDNKMASKIYQGVTTEIIGNCGESMFPITDKKYSLKDLNEFINNYYKKRISTNFGSLIGYNSVRINVMGYENRMPTKKEMNDMKNIIKFSLQNGVLGMSLGLIYEPGSFASTEELIELSKLLKEYNGLLTVHMRNEGDNIFNSIDELIEIEKLSKVHIHISHLKATENIKGSSLQILKYLDNKIEQGHQISMDAYPYDYSCTTLKVLLPDNINKRGGANNIFIINIKDIYPDLEGKSLAYISQNLNLKPVEAIARIINKSNDKAMGIYHIMDMNDVINFLMYKKTSIATDGNAFSFDNTIQEGLKHPRSFGTYPKFIRMVLDNKYITLEEAIYKMTFLPSKTFNLYDKGLIKEKYDADIVIFDPNTIKDLSTYNNLFLKPVGINYVIVNGKIAIDNGIQTDIRAGKFLTKKNKPQ